MDFICKIGHFWGVRAFCLVLLPLNICLRVKCEGPHKDRTFVCVCACLSTIPFDQLVTCFFSHPWAEVTCMSACKWGPLSRIWDKSNIFGIIFARMKRFTAPPQRPPRGQFGFQPRFWVLVLWLTWITKFFNHRKNVSALSRVVFSQRTIKSENSHWDV